MRRQSERGAAAVEMALVLPVLILLLLGIMEFGRAFNTQITLTSAARESVRVMAISKDPASAKARAVSSASVLSPPLTLDNVSPSPCSAAAPGASLPPQTTVTITYQLTTLTGVAGPFTLKAKGVMTCGG